MITAAQLWYICSIYPEKVTHIECKKEFENYCEEYDRIQGKYINPHYVKENSIKFLWECRANIINSLHNK